jgi:uncharacterized membrane protein YphA (DoxX/SURF4 family)
MFLVEAKKQQIRGSFQMNIALWIVQIVLALMFLMAGMTKPFQYDKAKASMPWVNDTSKGLVTFIGLPELLGAIGLILPSATGISPWLTPLAAAGLSVVMILAAVFHVKRSEQQAIVFNVVLLLFSAFVAYGRWFIETQ